MHDKPKYENGICLINLVIGWVKYMGEFLYVILFCFVLFRLTAYSLRKPFTKLKKKIDVHSVFKNGFIQRNSFSVVWMLQLVKDIFALFGSSQNC